VPRWPDQGDGFGNRVVAREAHAGPVNTVIVPNGRSAAQSNGQARLGIMLDEQFMGGKRLAGKAFDDDLAAGGHRKPACVPMPLGTVT
jgi:hypothetical protein